MVKDFLIGYQKESSLENLNSLYESSSALY